MRSQGQRGRGGRIAKPSSTSGAAAARGRISRLTASGNGAAALTAATAANLDDGPSQTIPPTDHHSEDEEADESVTVADVPFPGMALDPEQYAAAASAALQANMDRASAAKEHDSDGGEDSHPVDQEGMGARASEHMDLNAASILANGSAGAQDLSGAMAQPHAQQVAVPSLGGDSGVTTQQPGQLGMVPSLMKTTQALAVESGYDSIVVESALARRLAREPGLRLAQQRRPDQQLNLGRRSNVEALFAHIAGDLAKVPCKNCHKGHGPWSSCIVVDGQMCGSCANCWFNASGARCSFHETRMPPHLMAGVPARVVDHTPNHFALSQTILATPPAPQQHHHHQQQQMPTAQLAAVGMSTDSMTTDPNLRYSIEQAMSEVRGADRRTRQLMAIDVAAKQLALQIAAYEDLLIAEAHPPPQGQQQPHPPAQPQMNPDENGA